MKRAIKLARQTDSVESARSWQSVLILSAAFGWLLALLIMAGRIHLVMGYSVLPIGPAWLEPFLAPSSSIALGVMMLAVLGLLSRQAISEVYGRVSIKRTFGLLLVAATLPLVSSTIRAIDLWSASPSYWEPLWFSGWTGAAFAYLVNFRPLRSSTSSVWWSRPTAWIVFASCIVGLWWYVQSNRYYSDFLLGFNDFGHFAQRVANTAAGRGFLLESPVLPPFWDHFNPGLVLLVPLWWLVPTVQWFFAIQAGCLAGSGLLVALLARGLGHARTTAVLWGLAWLAQPAIGQMNIAYTYGWHPITLAIPALLGGLAGLVFGRRWTSLLCVMLACSMEEGAIVVVSLFCLGCAGQAWRRRASSVDDSAVLGYHAGFWLVAASIFAIGFMAVFRFSGLAEFQTGRFVALGDNAVEVLLSPILRPAAFWGELFQLEKFAFLASLVLPCWVVSLIAGWRWLIPLALPLGVLMAWDHQPATCIAFQYSSTLIPILWFATLHGSSGWNDSASSAAATGGLATGLVLSLFVGQLPYSRPSLLDVVARTYPAEATHRRESGDEDATWLREQLMTIRRSGTTVLATGRIAAHVVGNADVETVGQYLERREQLAELPDRTDNPIGAYEWIVLDRIEGFQQSPHQTERVESEARQTHFKVVADQFDIVILRRQTTGAW